MKRLIAMVLVLLMTAGTAITALAAPYDLSKKSDLTQKYSLNQVAASPSLLTQIANALSDYVITGSDGTRYYDAQTIQTKTSAGATFDAATASTTPWTNTLSISTVAATKATTLSVTFNRALTDAEKASATFAFTYASNPISMSAVTWDGVIAKVTRADAAVLAAGTYGVTVSGLTSTVTATGTVAAQKATTMQIATDRVKPLAAQALTYTVKDQYGDNMTVAAGAITVAAYNTTAAVRAANTVGGISNISFVLCNVNDVVKITAYLTADTSVKVVKDITVSNITVGTVTLGDATLPAGTTRFTTGTALVTIPVTALDNFGGATKLTAEVWANGVATTDGLVPTFSGIAAVTVTAAGNITCTLGAAGTATLTITNPTTGDIVNKTITVVDLPDTATLTMSAPTAPVRMLVNSAIPFTVKNQFGDTMTVPGAGWATGDVSLSSSNPAVATVGWVGNVITVVPVAPGTTTIFATVVTPVVNASTATNSLAITVNAAKAPTNIAVSGTPKTALAQGETVLNNATTGALKFAITDQDGAAINLAATTVAGVKLNLTKTDTSAVLAAPVATVLMAANMGAVGTTNGITVTANAVNGTATVTAQLFNDINGDDIMDAGEAISGAVANVTYTVSSPALSKGAISGITVLTANADKSAAYGALATSPVLTYALQDQAGNALTTTSATNVNWTITNTGANAITVNDGAVKTLAAGATATYTTVAAAGGAASSTITITSANEDKVTVSVVATGVATPATTTLYYTANVMAASQTFNGTVVAFDKTANWMLVNTSIGYVAVQYQNAVVFTGAFGFTVDGNTSTVAGFETALTLGDAVTCTSNAVVDLSVALTNK